MKLDGMKVVYWLGAGASANALPVVEEMPSAFNRQAERITRGSWNAPVSSVPEAAQKRYSDYLHKMAHWSTEYGTIDTYARSLHIHKNKESELAELKMHLSMFFMLDQLLTWSDPTLIPPINDYKKRDRIDTRYMGWLALMMEPDSSVNKNVKVVSWNYDLQIDHAIAQFKGYGDFVQVHGEPHVGLYPRLNSGTATALTTPNIIRLNGVAGFADLGRGTSTLYRGALSTRQGKDECIEHLFQLYEEYDSRDQKMLFSANKTFTFAWERTPLANEGLQFAKQAMNEADILVVIGYSFPSFNRKVDKELFSAFNTAGVTKKVTIQNPTMAVETFRQIMGISGQYPIVLMERGTDQFYIPPEFF